MTTEQLRQAVATLSRDITTLVVEFEKSTEMNVDSIVPRGIRNMNGDEITVHVEVSVKIPPSWSAPNP